MPEKSPYKAPEPIPTPVRMSEIDPSNDIILDDSKGQHNQDDTLPDYSEYLHVTGPSISTWDQQLLATPGLPNVNFLAYLPSKATLSSDHTTVTIRDKQLVTIPTALTTFILAQAALPPRPILHIKGLITGNAEFDLKIDMMRYFVRKGNESAWNYVKLVDINEVASRGESSVSVKPHCDTMLEWSRKFVESSASNKS